MKARETPATARKTMGNVFMATGVLLLAGFAGFKIWAAQQSDAGLDAFEAAREAQAAVTIGPQDETDEQAVAAQFTEWGGSPDTSTWSEKRVAEYEAAKIAAGEAPQAVLNIDHLAF